MGASGNKIAKIIGYLFVTFCVVVASIFCLVLFYAILNGGPRSHASPGNACINNLRIIDAAKQQWALENKEGSGAMPTWKDINPYLGRGAEFQSTNCLLHCPSGGIYTIGAMSNPPTCSVPNHRITL